MDDIRAVMDAADSKRAAVFGSSEGGPTAALFAATYPERTTALIMYGTYAKGGWSPDYPWGETTEESERQIREVESYWGEKTYADETAHEFAPNLSVEESLRRFFPVYMRLSASPAAAVAIEKMALDIDIRDVLPTIHVPTLILNKEGDVPEQGRWLADQIPGARYLELPGAEHAAFIGTTDLIWDAIEEFLTGARRGPHADRILATILFTDIVDSTVKQAALGDRGWKELVLAHHGVVREALNKWGGTENDTAGDGFFATFDGPARAIQCAMEIVTRVRLLGIEIRAGLHTGECELIDGKAGGIAVTIASRVSTFAGASEVLISETVKGLVAGSGFTFEGVGERELKGVPDRWRIFRVVHRVDGTGTQREAT